LQQNIETTRQATQAPIDSSQFRAWRLPSIVIER
jgi:hypothetical protein